MKLLNKSILYLSVSLFVIIAALSFVFYFNILNEIKSSIDEGLDNSKRQIIGHLQRDTTLINKDTFEESFFIFSEINLDEAKKIKDSYKDTLMYMQDSDDQELELEPTRLLTTAITFNDKFYKLQIVNSMVEEDDLLEELFRDAIGFYIILILCVTAINNLILSKLWKPFYDIINYIKSYKIENEIEFPKTRSSTKEFKDLELSLKDLIEINKKTFEQQRQFTGNASHELQTPLAILTTKLELLIEDEQLTSFQAKELSEVMKIISQMTLLNKSLLLLTKIENKQYFNNQSISISTLIDENLYKLEDLISFKDLKINKAYHQDLIINIDPTLAQVMIINILKNSIIHNKNEGYIHIEVADSFLTISNTSHYKELNKNAVFTKFYKENPQAAGTGLGLAFTKSVSNLYGFKVSYSYKNDLHYFRIDFK